MTTPSLSLPARIDQALADSRFAEAKHQALVLLADEKRHLDGILARTRCALAENDMPEALRWAERAFRYNPKDIGTRTFYAAVALRAAQPALTVTLLEDHQAVSPTSGVVLGWALRQLGETKRLLLLLSDLLSRFPPSLASGVRELADQAVLDGIVQGWAAPDVGCSVIGVLRQTVSPDSTVLIFCNKVELLSLPVAHLPQERPHFLNLRNFRLTLSDKASGDTLLLTLDGIPLLGMPASLIAHPVVEGGVAREGNILRGWAWMPADPSHPVLVRIVDEGGHVLTLETHEPVPEAARLGIEEGPHGFSCDPLAAGLMPGRFWVFAGESDTPLGGAPVCLPARRPAVPVGSHPARKNRSVVRASAVDILVPVYGGREETLACLSSLFESLSYLDAIPYEVIVIYDNGPDHNLRQDLARLGCSGKFTFLCNEKTLGFPGTVNRGLALHQDRDVVLLNADTLVAGNWLERLQRAAYAHPDTVSVTPLSNDGTLVSYPLPLDDTPSPVPSLEQTKNLDEIAQQANPGLILEIPTAVGFCVYLRRDGLTETGWLDEETFGRGYGEENDFSMRARQRGLRHRVAANVFVAHVGGRSFGRQKAFLTLRNSRLLEDLHPGYHALVMEFFRADPLREARRRIDIRRWSDMGDRPSTLLITLGLRGGVARFVEERIQAAALRDRRVLTLFPAPFPDELITFKKEKKSDADEKENCLPTGLCRLVVSDRPELRDLVFQTSHDLLEIKEILEKSRVDEVEIHHILGHSPDIISIPDLLNVPYDIFIHDYNLICPRINLVKDGGVYCGEPDLLTCELCVADPASRFDPSLTVTALRRRSQTLIARARRVVGATAGALSRLRRNLPDLSSHPEFLVVPWEKDLPIPSCPKPVTSTGRWRIAIIGAVGQQKGYDVLLACAEDAAKRDLPLEFILVGFSDDDARLVGTGRVFVTGRFSEAEAVSFTQSQGANLAFLPSISPETWCYALSVAWRAGLFVVAFDLGAIAERIREKGGGLLISPDLVPAELNEVLLGILDGSSNGALGCIGSHQIPLSKDPSEGASVLLSFDHTHSTRNASSMNGPLSSSDAPSPVQFQATPQVLSLAPGFYSVAVLEGGSDPIPGKIATPSVQITTPPVPTPGTLVELLGAHPGGWLTKVGDILVIRVTGSQAGTVILTSFKGSDRPNENLRLQLNRLDETLQTAMPSAVQALPKAELLLHISRQGDRRFPISSLAGVLGQQAWIEAFALEAVENIRLDEIEYKGLTANGWETPWVPAGELCGNRGMGMPLIGFCFRLKGEAANRFDCVYEGAFGSGRRTVPVTNGTPCRSDVIGDPLEGILLHLQPKAAVPPGPRVI